LTDTGKLQLNITHNGRAITGVNISSSRPQAFQLLKNKTPEQAVQLAQSLFSLCGKAQGAAAEAAVAAARGVALVRHDALERVVACEVLQEHWWRLLLDWPKMLGLPQQQTNFIRWHASLRQIAAKQSDMLALKREVESLWLGMPVAEWLEISHWQDFQRWWNTGNSPAANLFATLAAADTQTARPVTSLLPTTSLLPDSTATEILAACQDKFNADFAACPVWNMAPAETGALAYHADVPLLQQALRERPSRVSARVLARLYDALQMISGNFAGRLDYAGSQQNTGLAVVRTARGLLIHQVCIAADRVQDYLVVAPTEWNFHPAGTLVTGLLGVQGDARQLAQMAEKQVLSLDPCVGYEIKVSHA
jgi:hypothetical protein